MKRQKRIRKVFPLLLLCFLFLCFRTSVAHATELPDDFQNEENNLQNEVNEENDDRFNKGSPWMKNADDSIYSNSVDAAEDVQNIEPKNPGSVEKYFSELVRNVASSLISLLEENVGAGLDRIIYGRVGSGQPNRVNIYGFELKSGNPYGVTAAVCYSLVRSMAFLFLGIGFVFLLAKSAWTGQTAGSREQIKSSFYTTAMKFCGPSEPDTTPQTMAEENYDGRIFTGGEVADIAKTEESKGNRIYLKTRETGEGYFSAAEIKGLVDSTCSYLAQGVTNKQLSFIQQ